MKKLKLLAILSFGLILGLNAQKKVKLEDNSNAGNFYYNTGNVGIGVSNPSGRLHVKGETYVDGGWLRVKGKKGVYFQDYGGGFYMVDSSWIRTYGSKNFYHNKGIMRTDGQLQVGPAGNRFIVQQAGNVGIGSQNPDEKLTVKGKIHCEEVIVDLSVPADYVFQKYYNGTSALKTDYVMPTLKEVETFVKVNHHLPEVPSAKNIQEEGLQLKEMTNILLQKIEELTLYTIEQDKRIDLLELKLAKK